MSTVEQREREFCFLKDLPCCKLETAKAPPVLLKTFSELTPCEVLGSKL